jgi:triacylglycerol esterase/lipase EstA (alpha/beta hydrolase family)
MLRKAAPALIATFVALGLWAVPAGAAGPPLTVGPSRLAAALHCRGGLGEGPTPVLLVPGTTLAPDVNFDWNYEPALSASGRSWCAVTIPGHGMGDIQVAGQYIVYAIRAMHAAAHRRISIVGYSQGGMSPRWALKWWPDTRAMVDDFVSIDGSNHGSLDANALCTLGCAPSIWQQRAGSAFLQALNAGAETYAGISYTQVYSLEDEVVVPNFGSAASTPLHTGGGAISNVAVQSLCPVHLADHITMGTSDPVAYALVQDALTHAGPASAARIDRAVCLRLALPGITPTELVAGTLRVGAQAGAQLAGYPHVKAEPPLAAYAG